MDGILSVICSFRPVSHALALAGDFGPFAARLSGSFQPGRSPAEAPGPPLLNLVLGYQSLNSLYCCFRYWVAMLHYSTLQMVDKAQ